MLTITRIGDWYVAKYGANLIIAGCPLAAARWVCWQARFDAGACYNAGR